LHNTTYSTYDRIELRYTGNGCHGTQQHRIYTCYSVLLETPRFRRRRTLAKLIKLKNTWSPLPVSQAIAMINLHRPPFTDSVVFSHSRATIDYSHRSSAAESGLLPRHSGSTCFTAVMLRVASLLSALLALAAKENGIAALPIAITWDIIRLHQQSADTWHHADDDSGRSARCGGPKTYPSSNSSK